MNYRPQDFLKLIIPGLYLIALVFGYLIFTNQTTINLSTIKDLSSIIIFLIPFLGFVVGYFIECLMAGIEHGFYKLGGRRPSKNILDGSPNYPVASLDKIRKSLSLNSIVKNSEAREVLHIAKQLIVSEKVEAFRNNSILSRNLFGCQFVFTVVLAMVTDVFYKDIAFYVSVAVTAAFLKYWIHHNHVYVKYVLAEYAKTLE